MKAHPLSARLPSSGNTLSKLKELAAMQEEENIVAAIRRETGCGPSTARAAWAESEHNFQIATDIARRKATQMSRISMKIAIASELIVSRRMPCAAC